MYGYGRTDDGGPWWTCMGCGGLMASTDPDVVLCASCEGMLAQAGGACERCGGDLAPSDMHLLAADGVEQVVCDRCDAAYERARLRREGSAGR
jgi:hypothetical protein